MFKKIKKWAKELKYYLYALYLAYHRSDVPMVCKVVAITTVSYALSPVDLVPDFIPIIGYLDDLILIPIGISLAIKLMPLSVWNECKANAENLTLKSLPRSKIAACIIILIWIFAVFYFYQMLL